MATAWLDERQPDTLFVARGVGRPLWLGTGRDERFFASTKTALEVVEQYLRLKLRKRELDEGTLLVVEHGRVAGEAALPARPSYVEERTLPAVRAPHEGAFCLQRLAAIAAIA